MKRYQYITPEDYEIAEKNGLNRHLVNQRVYSYGYDIDSAITVPYGGRHRWGQVLTKEDKETAEKNGLGVKTVYNRLRSGMSKDDAITKPIISRVSPLWIEWEEIATKNNIRKETFLARVRDYKWDPERAATEPTRVQHRRKSK